MKHNLKMNENETSTISNNRDVQLAYVITENENKQCPVLTINISNNDSINLLQISDNHKSLTNQILNLPQSESRDEFTIVNSNSQIVYRVLRPEDLQLKPSPEVNVSVKQEKRKKACSDDNSSDCEITNKVPRKIFRTRSGRMSKPPRHIHQDGKELPKQLPQITINKTETVSTETKLEKKSVSVKRNISAQYRCNTCHKAYLGYSKMAKHLKLNPGHVAPHFNKKYIELNLWSEYLRKTKDVPKKQQARLFCKEFVTLIHNARTVIPKLLKPSTSKEDSCFTVDSIVSNALGIPAGNYSFDETVEFNQLIDNEISDNNKSTFNEIEGCLQNNDCIQNNDQNSLLNLLDTGQVNFDSTVTTEDVINVDQLVNERLKTLTGGNELEPTPSGSQNLSLDLSLDMFSYHTT